MATAIPTHSQFIQHLRAARKQLETVQTRYSENLPAKGGKNAFPMQALDQAIETWQTPEYRGLFQQGSRGSTQQTAGNVKTARSGGSTRKRTPARRKPVVPAA